MKHISFLLADRFSMIGLLSAVEPLRVANQIQKNSFSWDFVTPLGRPVTASNGMCISPEKSILSYSKSKAAKLPFAVFVCTGFEPEKIATPEVLAWLKKLAGSGLNLGGIDTGSVLLAKAGLLHERRATIHWEYLESFKEDFLNVEITDSLFEIDKNRFTCSGGTASIDMMLYLISLHIGSGLASKISEQLILEKIRHPAEAQRMEPSLRYGIRSYRLAAVVKVMEENLEFPLTISDTAQRSAISRRHMARLFNCELNTTPSRFYMKLRIERANRLLQQSGMAIADVAAACGFASSAYFSRVYKSRYNVSPGRSSGSFLVG